MAVSTRADDAPELDRFEAFWRDEMATAVLYRALADLDADRRGMLIDLAATEERHAAHWAVLLASAGRLPPSFTQPRRNRVLVDWPAGSVSPASCRR